MNYGYIRVSSDKQTVENQRYEILSFCTENNLTINGWIEETISGTKHYKRRALGRLPQPPCSQCYSPEGMCILTCLLEWTLENVVLVLRHTVRITLQTTTQLSNSRDKTPHVECAHTSFLRKHFVHSKLLLIFAAQTEEKGGIYVYVRKVSKVRLGHQALAAQQGRLLHCGRTAHSPARQEDHH